MNETRGWLPEEVAILPPGPRLHSELATADRDRLSDDDLVRLAQSRLRLISHLQAQLLADLHTMAQRCDEVTRRDEAERRSWAESEVAFAMTWTHHAASGQLCLAEDAIGRLPAVFAALEAGVIDLPKAKVFCDTTIGLETATARAVVDKVIGEVHKLTTGQLRARMTRLVLAEDPDVKRRTATEKVTGRRVWARLTDDGLAELGGYDLPPHRAAAAMERLTAIARAAKNRRRPPQNRPTQSRRTTRPADRRGHRHRWTHHRTQPRQPGQPIAARHAADPRHPARPSSRARRARRSPSPG